MGDGKGHRRRHDRLDVLLPFDAGGLGLVAAIGAASGVVLVKFQSSSDRSI